MTLPEWMTVNGSEACQGVRGVGEKKLLTEGFADKTLTRVSRFMRDVLSAQQERVGRKRFFLTPQSVISGTFLLLLACAITGSHTGLLLFFLAAVFIALFTRVSLVAIAKRTWAPVLFTLVITLPVFFGLFVEGGMEQGTKVGTILVLRVTVMTSLVSLLFLTTGEAGFFKGLSRMPLPGFFVTALFMTYRYILILLKIIEDTCFSRKSRIITRMSLGLSQGWFGASTGMLLHRSLFMSGEVSASMRARGVGGNPAPYRVERSTDTCMGLKDYLWLGFCFFIFFITIGLG